MLPIMCTRNLWRIVGRAGDLPARGAYAPTVTRLAAWSVREVATPQGLIGVGLEETTYLTVVFHLVPGPDFVRVFATAVGEALLDLGLPLTVVTREAATIAALGSPARNNNRRLIGSVNDVAFMTQGYLEGEPVTEHSMRVAQRKLNDMPHVTREPSFPSAAVRLLFAEGASTH